MVTVFHGSFVLDVSKLWVSEIRMVTVFHGCFTFDDNLPNFLQLAAKYSYHSITGHARDLYANFYPVLDKYKVIPKLSMTIPRIASL